MDSCLEGVLGQVLVLKGCMFNTTEETPSEIAIISRHATLKCY